MIDLTGKALSRLKEEYAEAVVEKMTYKEALAYLRQIIYNDVSVEDGAAVRKKIVKTFGEQQYDEMATDAIQQTTKS